jgi:MFS transporter, AAHS family, 4-hydroxybenzoate transporter
MYMDIKEVIDQSELSRLQYATILICFLMTVLDGMDIMIISYAAPTIAREWGVSPEALGVLFSSGLLGMAFGALFIALSSWESAFT